MPHGNVPVSVVSKESPSEIEPPMMLVPKRVEPDSLWACFPMKKNEGSYPLYEPRSVNSAIWGLYRSICRSRLCCNVSWMQSWSDKPRELGAAFAGISRLVTPAEYGGVFVCADAAMAALASRSIILNNFMARAA